MLSPRWLIVCVLLGVILGLVWGIFTDQLREQACPKPNIVAGTCH